MDLKWPERSIEGEFRHHNTPMDLRKVRKYQKHTDDLAECVQWCVNSIRNDREQSERRLAHETGAC